MYVASLIQIVLNAVKSSINLLCSLLHDTRNLAIYTWTNRKVTKPEWLNWDLLQKIRKIQV